jgi:hypothetical protein
LVVLLFAAPAFAKEVIAFAADGSSVVTFSRSKCLSSGWVVREAKCSRAQRARFGVGTASQ